jgi:hypothetical protein
MDSTFELKKNNYQPNRLTLSRQEWGVNERKILGLLINQLDFNREYNPEKSHIFKLPIQEVAKYVDYKYMKASLDNLQSCKIQVLDKEKDTYSSLVLFPEYHYNRDNSGKIEMVVTNSSLFFCSIWVKNTPSIILMFSYNFNPFFSADVRDCDDGVEEQPSQNFRI